MQASLIAAHVTLCREDEITSRDIDAFLQRARDWPYGPLHLTFGPPESFLGHGVMLPSEHGVEQFQLLRQWLLQRPDARVHRPHLTLAHPRNPRASDNTVDALAQAPRRLDVRFSSVTIIQQTGSEPWRVVREASLGGDTDDAGHTSRGTSSVPQGMKPNSRRRRSS